MSNDDFLDGEGAEEWDDDFDFDRFSEGDEDPFENGIYEEGDHRASGDPFYDSDDEHYTELSGFPSTSEPRRNTRSSATSGSSSSSSSSTSSQSMVPGTSPSRDMRMNPGLLRNKTRQHSVCRLNGGVEFLVLEESEVRDLCNQALSHVIEFYPVSRIKALQLLKQNKWDSEKVINFLVDSAASIPESLTVAQRAPKKQKTFGGSTAAGTPPFMVDDAAAIADGGEAFDCLICFETRCTLNSWSSTCGHTYCKACWADYFNVAIKDGEMFIECMNPPCKELIDGVDVLRFVSPRTFNLYQRIFYRQFVNDHPRMKWCPAPGCERAIEVLSLLPSVLTAHSSSSSSSSFSSSSSSASASTSASASASSASSSTASARNEDHPVPVRCGCGLRFCFLCADPEVGDHTPATCQEVELWMEKVSKEAENVSWIIANTKRCPKCRSPIEKNGGCMHMTCLESHGGCGHQWCWLCRGPWSEHGSATGGFYSCNKYDGSAAKNQDLRTQDARTDLERYMFYFHRYESHRNAGRIASDQHKAAETTGFHFQERFNVRAADTRFLQDATQQLVDSRRSLQWSYVYGYYLRLRSERVSAERNLFEYLQEDLEKFTNELSNNYERHEAIRTYEEFMRWKESITNYTRVTAKFFQNFVIGIQNGLTSAPPLSRDLAD